MPKFKPKKGKKENNILIYVKWDVRTNTFTIENNALKSSITYWKKYLQCQKCNYIELRYYTHNTQLVIILNLLSKSLRNKISKLT